MPDDRRDDHEQLDRIEQILTALAAQTDELHSLAKRAEDAAFLKAKTMKARDRARTRLGKKR
jgi:hypothetical protein